ncbi:MAG: hypothetical protein JJE25_11610, partial [Bacteroidia bacterium]|nr:hypothetical protein [Bacteroidia bacterium]
MHAGLVTLSTFSIALLFSVNVFSQITFQKTYNSGFFNVGYSVQQTNDGGYAVTGRTSNSGGDGYMVKTDLNGSLQWAQTFGGMRQDNIFSIRQTSGGGYILAGSSMSFSVDSLRHFYIARLNSSGTLLWDKTYGPIAGGQDIGLHFIRQTADGGFISGGNDGGAFGMIYMKTDSSGNMTWGKYIGGVIGSYGLSSIQQSSDGGYIITGNGNLLFKTNTLG